MSLPGLPSNSGECSLTIPNGSESSTVQAKFTLGNNQNYFDLRGGNNANVPRRPPAAGSITDWWPSCCPLGSTVLLPWGFQTMTEHGGKWRRAPSSNTWDSRALHRPSWAFLKTAAVWYSSHPGFLPSLSLSTGARPATPSEGSSCLSCFLLFLSSASQQIQPIVPALVKRGWSICLIHT